MRFSTSGKVRRIDLTLAAAVITALRDEWAGLTFGPGGAVMNPLTDEPFRDLVLADGRHRTPGARYELITRTPVFEPDPEQLRDLNAEMLDGKDIGAADIDWQAYGARSRAISVQTGMTESTTAFTLIADDARHLAVSVTDPAGVWSVEVDLIHGQLPRVELAGRHDATAMIAAEGAPGCLARLLGGIATGTASIDLAALEQRGKGTLAQASGQFNRFRGTGSVDLKTSARAWDVKAGATVRGRGLGRPLLWFFGSRARRAFDEAAASFWDRLPQTMNETEAGLRELADLARSEGGLDRVVRHTLWEDGYADRVMPLRA
ncbi:hypothetical protein [Aeromicrobium duanguangcaii]|uniref:Uncharacterized protein n=1 Tax=Aeromicrobium duanguangcaii TaxID=2968086 RepID=A0ABY5KDA2_9ACTN|nr:hypothetical protein [Aeromicrobium duanguangcaii]MCD9154495.1 hypothetical protein [Aeromicrobium duanguangcaii]UUI68449.1 hypothetical protein NP095_14750 [Aeromicrobium duanguangcaii]